MGSWPENGRCELLRTAKYSKKCVEYEVRSLPIEIWSDSRLQEYVDMNMNLRHDTRCCDLNAKDIDI